MIVRKIKPEEFKRTRELFAIAFDSNYDNSKSAEEVWEEAQANPETRDDYYRADRWAAFEDDGATMMCYFAAKPHQMNFDGNSCLMFGIGGVSSLPQYRRRGGIRACFNAALPEMYERGAVFSCLYPFSSAYYKKFGYTLCSERYLYKIRLQELAPYDVGGGCVLLEPGHNYYDEIAEVYRHWQDRYNLMVMNEDFEYLWAKKANPVKNMEFSWLYRNGNGTPKGYMTYHFEEEKGERVLACTNFFFIDAEGFKGLMNLAVSLIPNHKVIHFYAPADINLPGLLPEWALGTVFCERRFFGMVRVINVEQALRMARYRGSGELAVQVSDPQIEQNNGCFRILYENGKAVRVTAAGKSDADISANGNTGEGAVKPDISMPVGAFARLIAGGLSSADLEYMDEVTVNCEPEKLDGVFYRKPNMIVEYF